MDTTTTAWQEVAKQAPFAAIFSVAFIASLRYYLTAMREERRAAAQERAEQSAQFIAHLNATAEREDSGRLELRACVDRNTLVIARATVVMEASERREDERRQAADRREGDRRNLSGGQP